jgi:hypothetical protein
MRAGAIAGWRAFRDEAHYLLLRGAEGAHRLASQAWEWNRERDPLPIPDVRACLQWTAAIAIAGFVIVAALEVRERSVASAGTGLAAVPKQVGTKGMDTFTGTRRADRYKAGGSSDALAGAGGNDQLFGGFGDDTVYGGPGDDRLWSGAGQDVLIGGGGNDHLHAEAYDGMDRLFCGGGKDVAYVARIDGRIRDRAIGCERVIVIEFRTRRAR